MALKTLATKGCSLKPVLSVLESNLTLMMCIAEAFSVSQICQSKVEKILNQFIDKLNLPWKFEIYCLFQISRGD